MLIPVRCFTCGAVLGGKWEAYKKHQPRGITRSGATCAKNDASAKALDAVGALRYCCRMNLISHVDVIQTVES
jgi:DNA-directed RNA polymerase I, II, and III subunit RPABC5